jgi:hypothetical protein
MLEEDDDVDDGRRDQQAEGRTQDPRRNLDARGDQVPPADRHDGGDTGPESRLQGIEAFVGAQVEPAAMTTMRARPMAASGVSHGRTPVVIGSTRPAPRTSAKPMKTT